MNRKDMKHFFLTWGGIWVTGKPHRLVPKQKPPRILTQSLLESPRIYPKLFAGHPVTVYDLLPFLKKRRQHFGCWNLSCIHKDKGINIHSYKSGPILDSMGMHAILRKRAKKGGKKGQNTWKFWQKCTKFEDI